MKSMTEFLVLNRQEITQYLTGLRVSLSMGLDTAIAEYLKRHRIQLTDTHFYQQ
jgi:hypothetical protein